MQGKNRTFVVKRQPYGMETPQNIHQQRTSIRILTTLFTALLFAITTQAQNIAVKSFVLDETDLTANTTGTIVLDQNGDKCALIKVETTQTGFTFDVGGLGVRKMEQKVGEIWLYVPEGVKRITISHQQLGVLRDHDLGQTLKRARTYIMQLTTGQVHSYVEEAVTSQYVVFQLLPQNAVVELNGEMLATADGVATKYLPFGTYDYTVKAPDHLPEVGKVTVNDPKQKHLVNVKLRPNFSSVTLTVDNQAEIWVNGEKRGNGSWTGNLGAGTYDMETRAYGHRPVRRQMEIAVTDQPQTIHLDSPTPIYGKANINSTPAMADVSIDGKSYGQTPVVVPDLLVGNHAVAISRQGYDIWKGTVTVEEGKMADLTATLKKWITPTQVKTAVNNATPVNNSTPTGTNILPITVNGVTFNMILVEGGTFQMGGDGWKDQKPIHSVTLSNYYIGETEVTQALWEAVMGKNPSKFKGANRPVEKVSYFDCNKFIRKLNELTGRKFHLPSEAQWEYAARGGNKSKGHQYSGSNNLLEVAWFGRNSGETLLEDDKGWEDSRKNKGQTHEVKTKAPNELGIYDMSGNVEEWCYDNYGPYTHNAQRNPWGPSEGISRVHRGGGWECNSAGCKVSDRSDRYAGDKNDTHGLRLAL